ncbi:MAG TPA: hypothetical protein VN642_12065 [Dongiaceae bacterium]|nr:hypothetical protein [Dongiaceae bacterium]
MITLTRYCVGIFALFVLLLPPGILLAQADLPKSSPPPIGQPMVREGDFALKLMSELGIGTTDDEIEAETRLGDLGITPRNGWIADYPVTPDIMGELHKSVRDAATSGKISMNAEEASKRLTAVSSDLRLEIVPSAPVNTGKAYAPQAGNYPEKTVIEDYYTSEGPPVITYYTPPPGYYYLYSWVPYPFWGVGIWFPGFFILNDFHRVVHVRDRTVFVSNHFNDVRNHRMFRIDPVSRFRGRTYAGIGITRKHSFISTGVPRSERRIFNSPGMRMSPGFRPVAPSRRGDGDIREKERR